jgi:hypothetical protein
MAEDFLTPGTVTTREKVSERFGGGQGQGIQPCRTTANVLLYSDPEKGNKSGYYDGWLSEPDERGPIFEYTGHGEGHQTFDGRDGTGNRAILNHATDGRALRLFVADGLARDYPHLGVPRTSTAKAQRYIGKFELDADLPYEVRIQPNKDGILRRVIVFRLRPVEAITPEEKDQIPVAKKTEVLPVPASATSSVLIEPEVSRRSISVRAPIGETSARRREAELSAEFQAFLERQEHQVKRFQIRIKGTTSNLITDLYDVDDRVLYEVKASPSRENVRMAIGQLKDYSRHIEPANPKLAVLLPREPNEDLKDLLSSVNISVVWKEGMSFVGWPVG